MTGNVSKNGHNTACSKVRGFKVAKRRHGQRSKRPTSSSQASSVSSNENAASKLCEDDLLQLLISRIKLREKREMTSATLHEQMEAKILGLEDENKSLKDGLESSTSQLRKKSSEVKNYRTQLDQWKAKLSKFKHFLNDFGRDYQILRDEADRLKTQKASLETEKQGITDTVDEARRTISAVSQANCDRKQYHAEVENICSSFNQKSKSSERQLALTSKQLAEEKRRVVSLESFIQHNSHTQGRQLAQIRDNQRQVMDKIQSSSRSVERNYDSSRSTIQEMMDRIMHELLSSLNSLKGECTEGKFNTQQITDQFSLLASR